MVSLIEMLKSELMDFVMENMKVAAHTALDYVEENEKGKLDIDDVIEVERKIYSFYEEIEEELKEKMALVFSRWELVSSAEEV